MSEDCPEIIIERIRAVISFSGSTFVTYGSDTEHEGWIKSFNINRTRTQSISTMSCQLDVLMSADIMGNVEAAVDDLGPMITVRAGVSQDGSDTGVPLVFTGYITSVKRTPNFNDSTRFILNVSAEDVFTKMKRHKFSRRFKLADEAFATITGGKRRAGGNMTRLKRAAAGKHGIDKVDNSSSSTVLGEHSPLVRTPDPQGLSPTGAKWNKKSTKNDPTGQRETYTWETKELFGTKGARIFNRVLNTETMQPIDPTKFDRMSCMCHSTPKPRALGGTGGSRTGSGMLSGVEYFPCMVEFVTDTDPAGIGFVFTLIGDYPCKITFVHPEMGATCTFDINVVPLHDHRDAATGGSAVGAYDAWTL